MSNQDNSHHLVNKNDVSESDTRDVNHAVLCLGNTTFVPTPSEQAASSLSDDVKNLNSSKTLTLDTKTTINNNKNERHVTESEVETDTEAPDYLKNETSDSNETDDEQPLAKKKQAKSLSKQPSKPSKKKKVEDNGGITSEMLSIIYSEMPKRVRKPSVRLSTFDSASPNHQVKRQKTAPVSSSTSSTLAASKSKPSSVTIKSEPGTSRNTTPTNLSSNIKPKKHYTLSKKRLHENIKRESSSDLHSPNSHNGEDNFRTSNCQDVSKNYTFQDFDNDIYEGSYCICRRPDNGRWMIGCDTCDDWFHGNCVNLTEKDSKRFVKYSCPRCTAKGVGQSVYKRKCRLPGCNNPVEEVPANDTRREEKSNYKRPSPKSTNKNKKYNPSKKSKYCSKEHGILFFKLIVEQQLPKHKAINSMALSVGHLATLIRSSKTINQFHLLGTKFPKYDIPPSKSLSDMKTDKAEAKPSDSNSSKELHVSTLNIETSDNPIIASMKHLFTPSDKLQFRIYEARKTSLLNQINYLSLQRELIQICIKFTKKVSESAAKAAGVKKKDLCGYDPRLAKSREEWKDGELENVIESIKNKLENGFEEITDEQSDNLRERGEEDSKKDIETGVATEKESSGGTTKTSLRDICLLEKRKCIRHSLWPALFSEETNLKEQSLQANLEKVNAQISELLHNIGCRTFESQK